VSEIYAAPFLQHKLLTSRCTVSFNLSKFHCAYRIIFRDLKPENVAFDFRGEMRLFDFGLAKELKAVDLVKEPDSFRATGQTGSRRYMAPETVLCKNYGFSADVFSWAILTWEVFSGEMPFKRLSIDKHFQQVVVNGKRPKRLGPVPKNVTKLLEDAWHDDPSKRPSFRDICDQLGLQVNVSNSAKGESDRTSILANQSLRSRAESFTDSPKQSRLKVFLPQQESNS
jgi:serine/threonine protein kinase